jgi:hypothetical protein
MAWMRWAQLRSSPIYALSVTDLCPSSLAVTRANVLEHLVPSADFRLTFLAGADFVIDGGLTATL